MEAGFLAFHTLSFPWPAEIGKNEQVNEEISVFVWKIIRNYVILSLRVGQL